MSVIGILLIAVLIVLVLVAQVAGGFVKLLLLGLAFLMTVILLAMVARKLYRTFRAQ